MFSLCLFVRLLAGLRKKITKPIFAKFGGNLTHGPWKNPLDFGGNADRVTIGVDLESG